MDRRHLQGLASVIETSKISEQEWLDWRRLGIGASDVANVVGLGRFGTPFTVWANKVGLLPDFEGTKKMRAGKHAERMIAPFFKEETGNTIKGQQARLTFDDNHTHRATTDGSVYRGRTFLGGAEMKLDTESWSWAKIPLYYQCQGLWQMHCAGWDHVDFAVLHRGWDLRVYPLERDDAAIAALVERVDQFWADHVMTAKPPPVDDSERTAKALFAVYPHGEGAIGVDDMRDAVAELVSVKAEAKSVKARKVELENQLKARLADAEMGLIDGQLAVSWKRSHRKGYEVKATDIRTLRTHGAFKGDS